MARDVKAGCRSAELLCKGRGARAAARLLTAALLVLPTSSAAPATATALHAPHPDDTVREAGVAMPRLVAAVPPGTG